MKESSKPLTLVTGATGFTGGQLARELRRRGHPVRALARPGSNVSALAAANIEICEGQLVSADDLSRAMRGVGVVYHIAAAYREAKHPDSYYFDANVRGTKNILDARGGAGGVARVLPGPARHRLPASGHLRATSSSRTAHSPRPRRGRLSATSRRSIWRPGSARRLVPGAGLLGKGE